MKKHLIWTLSLKLILLMEKNGKDTEAAVGAKKGNYCLQVFLFWFFGGGGVLMFAIYPDTMMGRRLVAPAITATFLSIPSNQAVSLICSANH